MLEKHTSVDVLKIIGSGVNVMVNKLLFGLSIVNTNIFGQSMELPIAFKVLFTVALTGSVFLVMWLFVRMIKDLLEKKV